MNKISKFTIILLLISTFFMFNSCSYKKEEIKNPKYIFLFIGDGMGFSQVALTEAYLANINGKVGYENLTMTQFPVYGMCKTYCKTRQITDSGAAGSAIACGEKAAVESISYYDDGSKNSKSIAKIAHENGAKVGIIATVSLNHATPAAFYAINQNRNDYYEIGLDLSESNFEFFGGGAFYAENGKDGNNTNLFDIAKNKGYSLAKSVDSISGNNNLIFTNSVLQSEGEMPYCIDRKNYGGNSLAEIVKQGIKFLDSPEGFFMMVEGSQIDWACHENDAATVINEVIDFDDAIAEAYKFYLEHSNETLIIVTADHETGGISLGISQNHYESNFALLSGQQCSQKYLSKLISNYKKENTNYSIKDIFKIVEDNFYSEALNLNETELKMLNDAFNYYFYNKAIPCYSNTYELYGGYNPLAVTFTKILNNRASVGFATRAHTGADVPIFSIGPNSEKFSGLLNNTDIKTKILEIKNW